MKRMIRASYSDEIDRVTETLTRTISIIIQNVEAEVDENSIEFSNYDWAAPDGDGEHDSYWESIEDDPSIELDDTSGVAEKVQKLLLEKVFERVNMYRTFIINKCSIDLIYIVPNVEFEVYQSGVYTGQGDVFYNDSDIFWSEADSKILKCDYSRL